MAKILIIDDEESIRFTFDSFLSDLGHDVSTARDYHEAMAKVTKEDFDLIFLDIILGGLTGVDLLIDLKKKRDLRCPVVMITGYPNVETASEAVRLGAFDYISKPVRQDTLLHTTNLALQHKALQDENEKYRSNLEAIFRSVKDAIITVDRDLVVLETNEAATKICGIGRDSIGKPFAKCKMNCNGKCLEILNKTVNSKEAIEVFHIECEHSKRCNQVVTITTSPLVIDNNSFARAVMVVRDETRLHNLERNLEQRQHFGNIIGQNAQMQKIYSLIEDLSDVQTTVLIEGESGTGKELVAEAIHYRGDRRYKPLVKVNCSALSDSLLESELFGHVKGAFTGADRDKIGRFQKADGGTIFLDEIGDISPRMQLRLLRVLQEKIFERVGDSTPVKVDVRVIAATNQDLKKKVQLGEFRKDLYYRLKVVEIILPPLRDRKDDIPLLVNHFINKLNKKLNKNIHAISEDVQEIFMDYNWLGNVRELEHTLEHAFIVCRQDTITVDNLPANFGELKEEKASAMEIEGENEELIILEALKKAGWNKSKAARILGVNVRTIYRKIEKYNIKTESI
jgi:DNA-binding NtrC family response regulator